MQFILKFVTLISVMSVSGFSQVCDSENVPFSRAGYFLEDYQMRFLLRDSVLPRNKVKTKAEKIQSVQNSIESIWKKNSVPSLSSAKLADLIVDVASSVGVDYQILASVVKKESLYCLNRHNKRGGDSGCMQFTAPALTEIKHQLGFAGERKFTPGTPEVLAALASRFFKDESRAKTADYLKWLSKSIQDIKIDLRRGSNFEYDILTGAIYLKLYLSISDGNYGVAVRNYNGSRRKFAYQSSVMSGAMKISDSVYLQNTEDCSDDEQFADDVHKFACQLEDNYEECFNSYFRTVPGYL